MIYEPESNWLLDYWIAKERMPITLPMSSATYVDLGCAGPVNHSLTAFVRDLGWRGVAVDGNPLYRLEWVNAGFEGHFVSALLSDTPTARFCIHDNGLTSRISETPATDYPERWGIQSIGVWPTGDINQILRDKEIEKIDLLTVDLEGHEYRVLRTLDFERHSPAFVIVEYVCAGEPNDPRAVNLLLEKGYEVIQMFPSNMILRRK